MNIANRMVFVLVIGLNVGEKSVRQTLFDLIRRSNRAKQLYYIADLYYILIN